MNLHSNQIQFSAPEPAKAQFAQRENQTAQAIKDMGEVVFRGLEAKAQTDDEIFSSQMTTIGNTGLQTIEDAKERNANYDQFGREAIQSFVSQINSAPEDVRERFLRRNPTAIEDYTLKVEAAVALKTSRQLYNRLTNEIPRLASDVVLAPADQQESKLKTNIALLQNPNLTMEQVDNLTYELHKQVDRGLIASAIAQKDWPTALARLDNDDISFTLSPAERIHYKTNIESAMREEQKAIAEAKKKELEGKTDENEFLEKVILETFNTLVTDGRLEDAKKLQEDFVSGTPFNLITGGTVNSSPFSRTQKLEISGKMNTAYNKNPSLSYFNAGVQEQYFDTIRPTLNENGDSVNEKVDFVTYSMAKDIYDSPAKFDALTKEQQQVIHKIVDGYTSMVTESLYPVDYFVQVPILQAKDATTSKLVAKPIGNLTNLFREQIAKRADLSGVGFEYETQDGRKMTVLPSTNKLPGPQMVEGTFYNATKVFNDRRVLGVEIKNGTRAASVLYLALGLAMNSDTVTSSLSNAGAPMATANMLSDSLVRTLNDLWQSGKFDSEEVSEATVKQDLADMLFRINGRVRKQSDVEKITQDGIVDTVLLGIKNPLEMEVIKFKNIEDFYPIHATEEYLTSSRRPTTTEAEEDERQNVVKRFRKAMTGE